MGSLTTKDAKVSDHDEEFVARLREEGAIFLFQTTVPEFCASCMTWSRLYGVTRNPWNLPYGVGGSSGGSGASLAAGFCTLATGSDMGGSIRIPASMNGIYGFKPPLGRIPCNESAYMSYGPLARTFDDMVLMQDVMTGPSLKIHSSLRPKLDYPVDYAPIKGEKVAVTYFKNWLEGGCDRDVVKAMDETVAALEKAGAEIVRVELDWKASEIMPAYIRGLLTDSGSALVTVMPIKEQLCSNLEPFMAFADEIGAEAIEAVHTLQTRLNSDLQREVFARGCIALVMPTLATANIPADIDATPEKKALVNGRVSGALDFCLTSVFNLINNYPIATVPAGFSSQNVPIGVQVMGNTFDDLASFRVAQALSKVMPQNFRENHFPDFRNEK